MGRIFITGSSTGLGLMAGTKLVKRGHSVVLHARDDNRASDALAALAGAETVVVGDLETVAGSVAVASDLNALGRFDAVIHNAGIYSCGQRMTQDGVRVVFAVNVLAPYVLTSLMTLPERLIYLSSGMHLGAGANLDDTQWLRRGWSNTMAYSESKLYVLMLSFAVARLFRSVKSNGVDPGWVPTRMGGQNATDDLLQGYTTQVELAAPPRYSALFEVTGEYFHHMRTHDPNPLSRDHALQDQLIALCAATSGIKFRPPAAATRLLTGDQ